MKSLSSRHLMNFQNKSGNESKFVRLQTAPMITESDLESSFGRTI